MCDRFGQAVLQIEPLWKDRAVCGQFQIVQGHPAMTHSSVPSVSGVSSQLFRANSDRNVRVIGAKVGPTDRLLLQSIVSPYLPKICRIVPLSIRFCIEAFVLVRISPVFFGNANAYGRARAGR